MLANPFTRQVINSYFAECDRDDKGYCLPRKGFSKAIGAGPQSKYLASKHVEEDEVRSILLSGKKSWSTDILDIPLVQRGLKPERVWHTKVDGVHFAYTPERERRAAQEVSKIIRSRDYPKSIIRSVDGIFYTNQNNPNDEGYSRRYGAKFVSLATGGEGVITIHPAGELSEHIYLHEAGHNFAQKKWKDYTPRDGLLRDMLDEIDFEEVHQNYDHSEKFANAVSFIFRFPEKAKEYYPDLFDYVQKLTGTEYEYIPSKGKNQ